MEPVFVFWFNVSASFMESERVIDTVCYFCLYLSGLFLLTLSRSQRREAKPERRRLAPRRLVRRRLCTGADRWTWSRDSHPHRNSVKAKIASSPEGLFVILACLRQLQSFTSSYLFVSCSFLVSVICLNGRRINQRPLELAVKHLAGVTND